jgi:tetratricopeptide (TPR) repeat protein/O-antigen ligase
LLDLRLRERWPLYLLESLTAAALILTALLLTERTTKAQELLVVAGASWLTASMLAAVVAQVRGGSSEALVFNPTTLFFAVVAATFTVHAMDAIVPPPQDYSPNAPEDLPGLVTNFTPYFYVLLASTVVFVTWYGRELELETEACVATMIVYTSVAFELMLRTAGEHAPPSSTVLSMPLLWGPVLTLLVLWFYSEGRRGRTWSWTPLGGPVLALLGAGVLSTITSVYVHASSIMLLRIGAFAALFWLIANTIQGERQLRLYWLAVVGPLAGAAFVIVLKLVSIQRELGLEFVLTYRYQMSGIAGTNPVGLSMAIGVLFCIAALVTQQGWRERLVAGVPLMFLAVTLIATHSPEGLVALAGGLGLLLLMRFGGGALRVRPRLSWRAGAIAGAAAALIVLAIAVPNPYTSKIAGDVLDPSTGRSARAEAWQISFDSFRHNPVLGVGLHNYYGRTRYVDDFPSRVMTGVRERRVLLGATVDPWKNFVSFHPHNAYLAIFEGMGVFGVAVVLWLAYALVAQTLGLFRRGRSSALWWWASVPLAGVAMALAWSFVAQGEDITVIGVPFWPMLGLAAGAGVLFFRSEGGDEHPGPWRRFTEPVSRWWGAPAMRRYRTPLVGALVAVAFSALVARPLASELLILESGEATEALDNGRALDLAKWAHRVDPWNVAYIERLSDAELRGGTLNGAIERQEQVVRARRYYAPDHVRLGWLYWLANDPQRAAGEFAYAADLDRWDTTLGNPYMPLGAAYANLGRYDAAIDSFAFGFRVSPNTISDSIWLTDESGIFEQRYLDPVFLESAPGRLPIDLQRNVVRRLGHPAVKPAERAPVASPDYRMFAVFDSMHADYEAMVATDPDQAETLIETLGRLTLRTGAIQRAIELFQEWAQTDPNSDAAHYNLGLAYVAAGELDAAKAEFEAVIELSDRSSDFLIREPFSHYQLGVLALQEQPPDVAAAVKAFDDALDSYRWDYLPNLYSYRAVAEALAGDRKQAERDLDKELFLLGVQTVSGGPAEETGDQGSRYQE